MEAMRTIQTVENGQICLQLPEQFWGEEVEILVLRTQESARAQETSANETFDPRRFYGVAQEPREAIDDYLRSLREGWQ